MKSRKAFFAALASALVGSLMVSLRPADAFERRLHPAYCALVKSPNNGSSSISVSPTDGTVVTNGGQIYAYPYSWSPSPHVAICPVPNDSSMTSSSSVTVNIHVYDGDATNTSGYDPYDVAASAVGAQTCSNWYASNGINCSNRKHTNSSNTFSGDATISFSNPGTDDAGTDTSGWRYYSDMAFVRVEMPPSSVLRGLYLTQ
jgi:hypothetical protein